MDESSEKPYLLDYTPDELIELLSEWGEPKFRSKQISKWIYHRFAKTFDEMTDLSLPLRSRLTRQTELARLDPVRVLRSKDGHTVKYLLALPDGTRIESVRMNYEKRRTACISTQVGCGIGCVFCATGRMGLNRNLTSGEIVEQVLHIAAETAGPDNRKGLTHVVFMGMGEPFANYEHTMKAIRCLTSSEGLGLGARRITVSTVGLIPGIRKFSREGLQVNLSVSLHAATDELRSRLIPVGRKYPLRELIQSVGEYIDRTGRRVTFEWALIDGVNDTKAELNALVSLIRGLMCHVNLIPVNPVAGYPKVAPKREVVRAFQAGLERAGIPTTVRMRRGIDIDAGCGQLCALDQEME